MAVPTYNAAGAGGQVALSFINNGMTSRLSADGNVVQVTVGDIVPRRVDSSAPGADWTVQRTLGIGPRRVVWNVTLKTDTEADLRTVERDIEAYEWDGHPYTLTDGMGRTGSYATINRAARVGKRERTPTGKFLQRWRIEFVVLLPINNAVKL
jgi:hypothetical protein